MVYLHGCVAGIVKVFDNTMQEPLTLIYGEWNYLQVATLNENHGVQMNLSGCLS